MYEQLGENLAWWLTVAWLLPLAGFAIEVFGGYWGSRVSRAAAYVAVAAIGIGFLCSVTALCTWGNATGWQALAVSKHHGAEHHGAEHHGPEHHDGEHDHHDAPDAEGDHHDAHHHEGDAHHSGEEHANDHHAADEERVSTAFTGTFYTLGAFGPLTVSLDWYIDSLTLVMFTMVTLIATCIHIFAIGYMSDELTEDHADHQVHLADGHHLHRPGRFYKFFSYLSLFSFSMLGLVIAGNIFQVFVFWELVGICSYLLIGFYTERKSANVAANKAFIMNRVGDFGFLIGLMVIWTWCGTFQFVGHEIDGQHVDGLFEMVRAGGGAMELTDDHSGVILHDADGHPLTVGDSDQPRSIPYTLLVVAGLGIFAGCVGKSAQFPLQTWLPDAMEGPTPVSALVHSATMVAAGVYLAGRFFPMFTPEVLLTIAYTGCITLFLAATIAIVATDIKQVLAYSTISQLGYMMLAIGLGGWAAGMFHLITHAFFKSLMFLCSGSVIAACHHEQEMPRMGGLWRKMPITAFTMLVGVIAISGLAIPGTAIAFSGYHSKDAIVATALAHTQANPIHVLLFFAPLVTAGITAFYMFRLWFYTFYGEPRDREMYDHVHENGWVMTGPLLVLAIFAAGCAIGGEQGPLYLLLTDNEPAALTDGFTGGEAVTVTIPGHEAIHAVHSQAGVYALLAAVFGTVVAYLLYGARLVNPAEIQTRFTGVYNFLVEKWQFDELYDAMFVRPVRVVSGWFAAFDRIVLDGILHGAARLTVDVSMWDKRFDETIIDGFVNLLGNATYSAGSNLRRLQTGILRQYITFIAVSVVVLFGLAFFFFPN